MSTSSHAAVPAAPNAGGGAADKSAEPAAAGKRRMIPWRYIGRKSGLYVFILWATVTINYLIPHLMPGDPVNILVAKMHGQISPDAIDALRKAFGLTNTNLFSGYIQYLGSLLTGHLGLSISQYPTPVIDAIMQSLPWTIGLIGVSTVISFVIGTYLGAVAAWRRGKLIDLLVPASTFFQAIPYFWLAAILILLFGVNLPWFPISSGYDTSLDPAWSWAFAGSVIYHGLLPAISIIVSSMAGWLLRMRNMMITVLGEEYVTLAQAKGLSSRRIMLSYAARNAILPSLTEFSLALGYVVGGALLTEVVFSYPGVGFALFDAVQNEDFPLMQGIFLFISLAVICANILADIVYVIADPRTREAS
jgi:peptide/nickel transport system permease protein